MATGNQKPPPLREVEIVHSSYQPSVVDLPLHEVPRGPTDLSDTLPR